MLKFAYCATLLIGLSLVLAACGAQPTPSGTPTAFPFATATVGHEVRGVLSLANVRQAGDVPANPATAVARIARPTATPDFATCPPPNEGELRLGLFPGTRQAATDAILRYLNSGGSPQDLRTALRVEWDALGDFGYVRADVDLTGEGEPEVLVGYTAPGELGMALLLLCENGRYAARIELVADGAAPPELVWLADINNNVQPEVIFARRTCTTAEACELETLVLTWSAQTGSFVNLLDDRLISLTVPQLRDTDNDDVAELVINLDSRGTSATGPLRTGVNIYDWDGSVYTLSIIQLDAPRYRIQYVHQGDAAFSRLEMAQAADLYQRALETDGLRYWFNDGPTVVTSYALYRLVLAMAYEGGLGSPLYVGATDRLRATYPQASLPEDLPLYARMAYAFIDAFEATGNLHRGCTVVQEIISEEDAALGLLNRYGSRSPTYTPLMLCPY